jgi:glutathione S-transferase
VRIFLAEKGITIPTEQVDLGSLQQRPAACTAISPLQRVVRDDGAVLTESVAICRYFEALHLDPPLFGRDALESALIEMWNRRVLYIRVSTVFQHLHSAMKAMVDQQAPASGEANRPRIFDFLRLLDADWACGRTSPA